MNAMETLVLASTDHERWMSIHELRAMTGVHQSSPDRLLPAVKRLVRAGRLEASGGNEGKGTYVVRRVLGGAA